MRLYTAGIADFENIRQDGRVYVDKTDLIYRLSRESRIDYAIPYQAGGKPVVKIGIAFSKETKTVSDWKIING